MNISQTRQALNELELRPDKSKGQNFLVNPLAVRRIVNALGEVSGTVLEIGPGLGALTNGLVRAGHNLSAIELSEPMSEWLKREYPGVGLVTGDFLSVDPRSIPGYPFSAVASNLPYNISSQTVFTLCEPQFDEVEKAVLMFQKEMATRLACLDGGRNYGRLSLLVWPWFTVEKLFDLNPGDFMPRPNVDSSVVILKRRKDMLLNRDEYAIFARIVRAAFSGRRKKVINCLTRVFGKTDSMAMLEAANIDPDLRAERIEPEKFAELAGKAKV
ncbi:MAG: 16S rRNA (adenine(1518)-N(6)/adenine(1519)-N(6))-dimethyltransferase RsmA [Candidatus Sabulitectum sp.]|nr:16S rRNA (adenine(1518)-N(6)/adenine(1519)-N(6))-dimethyltransferase RsmA [Candidatus Sabulitectum sp.]